MPAFVVKMGLQVGRRYDFQKEAVLGRDSMVSIAIYDRTISRRHATVAAKGGTVVLTDLGSQNGTAVNGRVIKEPVALRHGDEVRVGGTVLEFRLDDKPEESSQVVLVDAPSSIIQAIKVKSPTASLIQTGRPSTAELTRRLQLVHDVGAALRGALEESTLFPLILGKLLEVFPVADRGFILLHDAERDQLLSTAVLSREGGAHGEFSISKTLVWDAFKSRSAVISADASADTRFAQQQSVMSLGLRSVICVPMLAGDEAHGVIALDSLKSSGAFNKDDMALLVGIAAQAGLAVANARLHRRLLHRQLLERDLELAVRVQSRFLPQRTPERAGWDFHAFYKAALEIGGDYYDFLDLPGNQVGVAVGDVSGKGISAALCMVKVATEVRYQSVGTADPAEILGRVNRVLTRDLEEGMFVTSTLIAIDPDSRRVRVASAGHMAPLVRRGDGTVVELAVQRTPPLGVNEAVVYSTRDYTLAVGDTVVLFTDGISEAHAKGGVLYGEDRLVDAMAAAGGAPEDVLQNVLESVAAFAGDEPQADDITLLSFGPTGGRSVDSTWRRTRPANLV